MRYLATIVLLLLSAAELPAQSPRELFEQANTLYQQNKIQEARDLYESIVMNGYASGELHYNLGNAYYRVGDLGRAILNYERARRFMPADEDLRHNLQLANLRIVDRIDQTPKLFIWEWWDTLRGSFSARSATWFAYGFLVLTVGSAIVLILARGYVLRKAAMIAGGIGSALLIFSVVLLIARISDETRRDEAVVVAPLTTVKNSPDARSTDAFVLHAGVKALIIDQVNEWVKIRLVDGKVGWMERDDAVTI